MRVLYVSADPGVPVLGHKGASVHVRELATALGRLGAEVAIASARSEPAGDRLDARIALFPVPRVVPGAPEREVREALATQREALLDWAQRFGADAIYERYSLYSDAGVEAAAALGIPHLLEVNAPLREEARRFRTLPHPGLAQRLEEAVYRMTGGLLVVSAALKRRLVAEGVDPARIAIVPNAVAPERFGARRRRHDDDFVVGFCGSLKVWHGVEVLLEACSIAAAEEPSIRLEVVGHGPLQHLLHDRGPRACRLDALGALPHSEATERMREWDAGVAPYLPLEEFYFSPLKVLEYMAAAICPVASALGDIPELLGEGERGVLVPPGDAASLAVALILLSRDRSRAMRLGDRACRHVLDEHTWERNADVVLKQLRERVPEAVT
jgi:glycosyltransferase involved in cell wall biosynthesis